MKVFLKNGDILTDLKLEFNEHTLKVSNSFTLSSHHISSLRHHVILNRKRSQQKSIYDIIKLFYNVNTYPLNSSNLTRNYCLK